MTSNDNTSAGNKLSTNNVFKFMCKIVRITCFEHFWYEPMDTERYLLFGYVFIAVYVFIALSNEGLEIIFNNYPKDLHRDVIVLNISQSLIIFRAYYYSYKRKEVKELIKEIIDVCGEYEVEHIQRKQYIKFRFCLLLHLVVVYGFEFIVLITGLRRYFYEDQPFVIIPAYWPKYEDVSTIGIVFKVAMYLFIVVLAAQIIAKDSLVILKLIAISYKFTTLAHYFENLCEDFENDTVSIIELKYKCLKGVLMHRELLRITKKIARLYAVVLSMNVSQGFAMILMLMLQIAFTPDLINIIWSLIFMSTMVGQLGLFMWNAGEITYQASLLPTSIFHCGWHLRPVNCEHSREIRRIVLMGCLQAQRPLILKAFGIQDVSYSSFVSVIQTSYSIYAVLRPSK